MVILLERLNKKYKYSTRDGESIVLYTASTAYSVCSLYAVQTALHCLISMYVHIYMLLGKIRMLWEWVDRILDY